MPTPAAAIIDEEANAAWDKIIAGYENGLEDAMRRLRA